MDKVTIQRPDDNYINNRGLRNWPIWEKEVSNFPWKYDATEECYILEGEVDIITDEGVYSIKPGDFVTFAKGLSCRWQIRKPIRKHYNFL
jgi:uncharacterized cupin superfamily protein